MLPRWIMVMDERPAWTMSAATSWPGGLATGLWRGKE